MSKSIIWQKWIDPFGLDDNEYNYDPYVGEYASDSDEYEEDEEDEEDKISLNKKAIPIKAIATPMGIIPINENTISSKLFNFWMGHANFDISPVVANIIESTDGVETLDIFTRYRFRISVGKAFDDSAVMRSINNRVYNGLNDD
jgi:hypothetical protein